MIQIIKLIRPHQWVKNGFVFAPAFFNGHITDASYFVPSLVVFIAFCFLSSSIYCFNDILDAEVDRLHPKKRQRPIASGAISKTGAYAVMAACLLISFLCLFLYQWDTPAKQMLVAGVLAFYFLMNIAYCVVLKQKSIVDVFVIATGFVLRIFAGGMASGVELSHWLILMTFLLALFLAFAKRRDDVVMFESTGTIARRNVVRYNLTFMNEVIGLVASITLVCYIMYSVSPEVTDRFQCPYVYATSVFVLAGIIRYLQITIVDVKSGSPTRVLMHDHFVQACIAGWLLTFAFIIYYS